MTALFGADPYFVFIVGFGVIFMIVMLSYLVYFFVKKIKEEQEREQSKK